MAIHIGRRELIVAIGGAAIAMPFAAHAQPLVCPTSIKSLFGC
jgi:hypothetical protein